MTPLASHFKGTRLCAGQTTLARQQKRRRARASFGQGWQSQMEVSLAESSVAEAEGSMAEARAAVGKGFAALRVAMGVEGAPEYSLQAPKTEVVTLPPLESLVQDSMKDRPDAQAMDWKVRAFSEAAGR